MTRPPAPCNLGNLIRDDIDRTAEALVDLAPDGRRWTYGELDGAIRRCGAFLAAAGCVEGDRIAIIAPNSAAFLIAYLGAMRAGMVAVSINYRLPVALIAAILDDCDPALVLLDAIAGPPGWKASLLSAVISSDGDVPDVPPAAPTADRVAEILYTSGSTGKPKGVPLSHHGQCWALSMSYSDRPLTDETSLIVAPLFHMNALMNAAMGLMNAVRIVLMPRFDAVAWLNAIADHRCTILSGVPSMYAMAARETELLAQLDLSSVRAITIGSAPLTDALLDRVAAMFPNAAIRNGYGATEAGPAIFGLHPSGLPTPPSSIGYPLDQVDWRLTDETTAGGVFVVRTPATFKGYLNRPDATSERLRDGWYDTGDILRRDADGFFYFVGRADDMFVCGGENVYPGEIEKLLERHPAVAQAAVVAVPDVIKGQIPIAFVVPTAPSDRLDTEALKAFTLREGPAHAHPRAIVVVDRLPVNGPDKIDRAALRPAALEAVARLRR